MSTKAKVHENLTISAIIALRVYWKKKDKIDVVRTANAMIVFHEPVNAKFPADLGVAIPGTTRRNFSFFDICLFIEMSTRIGDELSSNRIPKYDETKIIDFLEGRIAANIVDKGIDKQKAKFIDSIGVYDGEIDHVGSRCGKGIHVFRGIRVEGTVLLLFF